MSAYVVANFRITDLDAYQAYPPLAVPTILRHGGQILVADRQSEVLEGSPGHVTIVARFPSKEAATGWWESEEYQNIKHHRTENSEGFTVVCDEVLPPS